MYVLGISALYHDSAACLIKDGEIIAAAQEERFTRIKHDSSIPVEAIKYCICEGKISAEEIDVVVYYDQPILTLDRFIENLVAIQDEADSLIEFSFDKMFSEKLWVHKLIEEAVGSLGKYGKLLTVKHHISHAASAFYPSPYDDAIILTIDGVGEWTTTAVGIGHGNKIKLLEEIKYPHSLGLLYSAFTYYCGFKVNSGDYKFMGLAPYGEPIYYEAIKEKIIDIKEDGSYRLNLEYFDYYKGKTMINENKFIDIFGGPRREPESLITEREMNIAASVQKITEEIIILMATHAKRKYGHKIDNLVIAGGVGLNCVANGRLQKAGIFNNIWIQPAAGDAGGALGAALYVYYEKYSNKRKINNIDSQKGSLLGPCFKRDEIKRWLDEKGYPYCEYYSTKECTKEIAKLLSEENIVGLFRGRMEYGPRALGNRSIIADCRSEYMQSRINMKIKYRESFRPFAPIVLDERMQDYFDLNSDSPYMLKVGKIKEEKRIEFSLKNLKRKYNNDMTKIVSKARSDIPAVTHVDYSARIQTVDKYRNIELYNLLKEYEKMTGCGVLVNTSFNVRGEPIVCTPNDAYRCFMRTDMDILVLEDFILYKNNQPQYNDDTNWREQYELD